MSGEDKERALTIRLPESLHEQLKQRAAAEERTVAGVIRWAAKQYLSCSTTREEEG